MDRSSTYNHQDTIQSVGWLRRTPHFFLSTCRCKLYAANVKRWLSHEEISLCVVVSCLTERKRRERGVCARCKSFRVKRQTQQIPGRHSVGFCSYFLDNSLEEHEHTLLRREPSSVQQPQKRLCLCFVSGTLPTPFFFNPHHLASSRTKPRRYTTGHRFEA